MVFQLLDAAADSVFIEAQKTAKGLAGGVMSFKRVHRERIGPHHVLRNIDGPLKDVLVIGDCEEVVITFQGRGPTEKLIRQVIEGTYFLPVGRGCR